jgi:hypothetical protein
LLFGSGSGPEWNSFKATWGPNPLSREYFVNQPLTVAEAKKNGYEQISGECGGEYRSLCLFFESKRHVLLGKFLGQRFMKDKDIALILLYDTQGTIAGVQMAVSLYLIDFVNDSLVFC